MLCTLVLGTTFSYPHRHGCCYKQNTAQPCFPRHRQDQRIDPSCITQSMERTQQCGITAMTLQHKRTRPATFTQIWDRFPKRDQPATTGSVTKHRQSAVAFSHIAHFRSTTSFGVHGSQQRMSSCCCCNNRRPPAYLMTFLTIAQRGRNNCQASTPLAGACCTVTSMCAVVPTQCSCPITQHSIQGQKHSLWQP